MKHTKAFMMGAAALALFAFAPQTVNAKTVTTKTYTTTETIPGATKVNFAAFDINNDGRYSMREVGNKLFYLFDTDGNEVIDNIEWNNKNVMTITPMEKETFTFVDYDDDGVTDSTSYEYDKFYSESGLIRFDEYKDGLSAHDFVSQPLGELDKNNNNMIELNEWKTAYFAHIKEAESERFN